MTTKRTQEEVAAGDRANAARMAFAAAPEVVECEFCHLPFKPRGLKIHQSRCKAKTAKREPSQLQLPQGQQGKLARHKPKQQSDSQQPRKYRFPISDEHLVARLLSFLSNQSQTKLQLATGDRYPSCEPLLSRYCCACEEDNPAMLDGLCSVCTAKKRGYKPLVTKTEAKKLYCLKDLTGVPTVLNKCTLADLDRHAVATYGSRNAWLRVQGPHTARVRRREAEKKLKRDETEAFLQSQSPAFVAYARSHKCLKIMPKAELEVCSRRFSELVEALKQRGLELPVDSSLCDRYVAQGDMELGHVVNSTEEEVAVDECRQAVRAAMFVELLLDET